MHDKKENINQFLLEAILYLAFHHTSITILFLPYPHK